MPDEREQRKDRNAKIIRSYYDDLKVAEKATALEKLKLRCRCPHQDPEGRVALIRSSNEKSPFTGNPLFACRMCGAYVDISSIDDEELNKAIESISRMSEVIKMRLNGSKSEKDEKAYKKVVRTQFFLKAQFMDLAKAARNRNKKKNKGGNGSRFNAGRPTTH